MEEVAKDYPDVALEHMLVDNCAMQLVKDPGQFDVILTENMLRLKWLQLDWQFLFRQYPARNRRSAHTDQISYH